MQRRRSTNSVGLPDYLPLEDSLDNLVQGRAMAGFSELESEAEPDFSDSAMGVPEIYKKHSLPDKFPTDKLKMFRDAKDRYLEFEYLSSLQSQLQPSFWVDDGAIGMSPEQAQLLRWYNELESADVNGYFPFAMDSVVGDYVDKNQDKF